MSALTAQRLREVLHYDPETGHFTWVKPSARSLKPGDRAGSEMRGEDRARRYLMVDGKSYYEHRLAWLYMTGEWPPVDREPDHEDRNGLNNRWANLRLATHSQNCANRGKPRNNTSGFKGAYYKPLKGKYQSLIRDNGRLRHLGYFDTAIEAHEAYKAEAKRLHGEFARAE